MQALLLLTNFLFFLFLVIFVFFIPGNLLFLAKKEEVEDRERVFLSIILGFVFFICLAVILGFLKLRFLSWPIFFILDILAVKKFGIKEIFAPFGVFKKEKILLLFILLGILIQGLINFPSGFKYSGGIYFWSSQGHDGLWHVALIKEMANHFPLNNPLFAGKILQNYHYTCDLLMGEFYRLFSFFDPLDLYFRFFPVVFSFLIGLGVFCFTARKWQRSYANWAVFFTYFCGSFGYIVSVLRGGFLFTGETTFWAAQGNTVLGNPPHALGIIMITACALCLVMWEKLKDKYWLFVFGWIGFALATVKVSSGLIMLLSLGTTGLYFLIKEKKIALLVLAFVLGISNFIALKLISPKAESFLMFLPLWFSRTMMVDKLGWVDWELRRQHYIWKNTWHSWLRVVQLETQAVAIFIVGNSGIRILGFFDALKRLKKTSYSDVFLFSAIISPIILVLLFVQKGIIYNFIQFMQIYLHFLGVFAGVSVAFVLSKIKNIKLKFLLGTVIVFLAIPTVIGNIFDFYGPKTAPNAMVSNSELEALSWLKNNSDKNDVVLTKPFVGMAQYRFPHKPWPISWWYSTPYVFVFADRYTYLSGEEQLMITGYKPEEELILIRKFFSQPDGNYNQSFLKKGNIAFIYLRKDEIEIPLDEKANNISLVFSNEETLIYKTKY